jgi:hypothetical protein
MEDFSFIRLYGFQGKPYLLPFYVSNKLFTIKVCRQYKYWAHFFNEKRKKSNSSLYHVKIGEIFVKNISHLDEFTTHFDQFNLKEVHAIHGFDPNNLFSTHMFTIGYGSSFNKSIQLEEGGGDNQNPPEVSPETTLDDIDTLVSTNDHYKKWG